MNKSITPGTNNAANFDADQFSQELIRRRRRRWSFKGAAFIVLDRDPELITAFEQTCERQKQSPSDALEMLLRAYITEWGG